MGQMRDPGVEMRGEAESRDIADLGFYTPQHQKWAEKGRRRSVVREKATLAVLESVQHTVFFIY